MTSKNFTAAEKHFNKKADAMRREMGELRGRCSRLAAENARKDEQIAVLEAEVAQLKDWNERLLNFMELDPKHVKAACEKDRMALAMLDMLRSFSAIGARI